MDTDRFDALLRSLLGAPSRRGALRLLASSALGGLLTLGSGEGLAKKRGKGKKGKGKKKRSSAPLAAPGVVCTPQCLGRRCGGNGCGGSCGACAECQTCQPGLGLCPMTPGSDAAPCSGGACCGGACCPPSCQCGVSGSFADQVASWLAESQGLPYPACFATGTGQTCGAIGGTCPSGTTCEPIGSTGVGVCVGLCAGISYPSI